MIKKYISLFAGLVAIIGFAFVAHAETTSSVVLSRTLSVGATGNEVVMLQNFLKDMSCFSYGTATGYFGPLTKAAVINFQTVNSIAPIGIVGPITRAKIASGSSASCKVVSQTVPVQTQSSAVSSVSGNDSSSSTTFPQPLPVPAGGILGGGGSTPDTMSPTAPTELAYSDISETTVDLLWNQSVDDRSGVSAYSLERCQSALCTDFAEIVSGNITSYVDTGLSDATQYRYRVRALDGAGNYSDYSEILSLTTVPFSYTLTVTLSGSGMGLVTSTPAGISCGATCAAVYTDGTMVSLTATPQVGSVFSGWSGGCAGSGACVVTVDQARNVTATFEPATYSIGGTVSGYVTSGLVLQNNGGDNLSISSDGMFTFATPLTDGAPYNVTVLSQPPVEICNVTNGSGTISGSNVTNVDITCFVAPI